MYQTKVPKLALDLRSLLWILLARRYAWSTMQETWKRALVVYDIQRRLDLFSGCVLMSKPEIIYIVFCEVFFSTSHLRVQPNETLYLFFILENGCYYRKWVFEMVLREIGLYAFPSTFPLSFLCVISCIVVFFSVWMYLYILPSRLYALKLLLVWMEKRLQQIEIYGYCWH